MDSTSPSAQTPRDRSWRTCGASWTRCYRQCHHGAGDPMTDLISHRLDVAMADMEDAVRRAHQNVIDAEVRESRRRILAGFRDRLRADPDTLHATDFLAVADDAVVHAAIVTVALRAARADACDLQIYDAETGALHLAQYRGFPRTFTEYFAEVDADAPTACGRAMVTGDPVLVDDVGTSPVFAGHRTRDVMLAAGSRAVHSY